MKGTISNIGLLGGSVAGDSFVGGLVGLNSGGTITRAYTTGTVSGSGEQIGGLVGNNSGTISQSYATGAVSAPARVGGLVGLNNGSISQAYATGAVNGAGYAGGGLVGTNGGTINQSYATGAVSGTEYVGGLVATSYGSVINSYWDRDTSGQATSAGGTGKSTAEMQQVSTFVGWNLATSGGSNAVWRIYEGHTAPLLRSFMTNLTLAGAPDVAVTYNSNIQSGASISAPSGVLGAAASGTNAGFYNGYYSTQQGYDITGGNLTINAVVLNASGTRTYDGTTDVAAGIFTLSGLINNEDLLLTGVGTIGSKNVGTYNVNLGSLTLGDGSTGLASNYTFEGGTQTATIGKADLAVTGASATNKTYDGTTAAVISCATVAGFGTDEVILGNASSGSFGDKNVGNGKTVSMSADLGGADAGNYNLVQQSGLTADIGKADLAVTGASATNKTYDGTTAAVISGATVAGFGTDEVILGNASSGSFGDKNVGNGKTVSMSADLGGADAGNYNLVQQSGLTADIGKADLAVTGASATNKTYDGTTAAVISGATVAGFGTDQVILGNASSGSFGDKNVGNGKTVSMSADLGGADAGNYNLVQQSGLTADIGKADLAVTGASATNKTYDGTTAAVISGATVAGFGTDEVILGNASSGSFGDKNVGNGKTVSMSADLGGADAGNYNLVQQSGLTADIGKADLAVTGASATNKTYDGTTAAVISGATVAGFGTDEVILGNASSGSFGDKNVGNGKTVSMSADLGGADAGNSYNLVQQSGFTADIGKADSGGDRPGPPTKPTTAPPQR